MKGHSNTMGAAPFTTYQTGADPAAAFHTARAQAHHEHGHNGDTGTIAEKDSYTIITATALSYENANALAQQLIAADDDRITDTRGPAGAIPVKQTTRRQLEPHDAPNPGGPLDAEALQQITDRARAAGLIGEAETVTAARRYDHARTDLVITKNPAAVTANAEPDGWLFFGWVRE
jgi:hypothetical protein